MHLLNSLSHPHVFVVRLASYSLLPTASPSHSREQVCTRQGSAVGATVGARVGRRVVTVVVPVIVVVVIVVVVIVVVVIVVVIVGSARLK